MADGDCSHQPCRCARHRPQFFVRGINASGTSPLVGRVSFSSNAAGSTTTIYWCTTCNRQKRGSLYAGIPSEGYCECPPIALGLHPDSEHGAAPEPGYSRQAPLGMIEHVQRAVEDDAATVVELVQRGDSWHVSISAGAMHYENAESSLPAALEAVGRVLGESAKARRYQLDLDIDTSEAMAKLATLEAAAERVAEQQRAAGQSVGSCAEVPTDTDWRRGYEAGSLLLAGRAELLVSLPPVQITDPEALAKLTPARVRSYLSGKWRFHPLPTCIDRVTCQLSPVALEALASFEGRSAAAVYLDILQTEPGDS